MNKLKIKNLNFNYGTKKVLNNINIELENGVVALLGPNGAGKSTLMRLIVTLFEYNSGEIYLNNLNYKKNKGEVKEQIGYIPQDFNMYNNITGKDYLLFVGKMRGIKKDKLNSHINEIISKVNLDEFINEKIGSYSGGVKRRLGIAQSIIGNPKIIVMDEPTVGLDIEQRNEFRKLLPIISKDRIVIISTHIVEDIRFNCNQLIVINKGKVLYDGSIDDFTESTDTYLTTLSPEEFDKLDKSIDIVDFKQKKGEIEFKYITSNKILKNSKKVETSLQDAYLDFLRKESR